MAITTSEKINEIFDRAKQYADSASLNMSTSHLLLAVLTGKGSASKTLTLRGLSETHIRTAIRTNGTEPEEQLRKVESKTRQYAGSLGLSTPSALHLLAAITTVKSCHGYQILADAGLNTDVIRNQALRNMTTGLTREHGNGPGLKRNTDIPTNTLPLPNVYPKNLNQQDKKQTQNIATDPPKRANRQQNRQFSRGKSALNMGQSLEQAQKKTRVQRSKSLKTVEKSEDIEPLTLAEQSDCNQDHEKISPQTPTQLQTMGNSAFEFELDPAKFPILESIGRNMTEMAAQGAIDEIIGRDREMEQITDVLNKRRSNCPCLVGPPGVGKTAVVEGLALRIARGEAPGLKGRIIVEVKTGDLLSGTSVRGALSERLDELKAEIKLSQGQVVLFFDEIHSLLISNDGAEAIAELKSSLGRGEMPCIAATTNTEYARHVESDPALARRFGKIEITEPNEQETLHILKGIAPTYSKHHGVEFTPEALEAATRLSARYISDRALPDKAVALLDLAGAKGQRSALLKVTREDIAGILAEQIDVPVERLSMEDQDRLLNLEADISKQIIGHSHVQSALGETLRRNAAGFRTGRPIGSFLFLGPTGVGKTETAKALTHLLFADKNAMVRLDMSEFSEPHAVARMIGAPPGYIGHEDGGQLTEAVKKRPYCLILLDEIEKAHRDVIQLLLQVLDDGRLTDGKGRTVVFENTVIIMTSNLGSDLRDSSSTKRPVGFASSNMTDKSSKTSTIAAQIEDAAKNALPPELWNRIDEPLVFNPLTRDEVSQIAMLLLNNVSKQLHKEHSITLHFKEGVISTLISSGGFDAQFGARPMRRTIQRLIEGPISKIILSKEVLPFGSILIEENGTELSFVSTDTGLDDTSNTSE